MQVADKMAVSIHYTLTNDDGKVLDTSVGNDALIYLHGSGNIIPGLESALNGKSVGDKFNVRIPAEDAYGERHEEMIQVIPRSMFQGVDELEVGMVFHAEASSGPAHVMIVNIEGDNVTIDGNHALAGVPLTFDVEVVEVRPATEEEIAHGHIHSDGCHDH